MVIRDLRNMSFPLLDALIKEIETMAGNLSLASNYTIQVFMSAKDNKSGPILLMKPEDSKLLCFFDPIPQNYQDIALQMTWLVVMVFQIIFIWYAAKQTFVNHRRLNDAVQFWMETTPRERILLLAGFKQMEVRTTLPPDKAARATPTEPKKK